MNTEIIELCAYHESARVAYAYQFGYYCENIELSASDAGGGISKLNGGGDNEAIQLIFSNTPQANAIAGNKEIEVAKKLMKIYCAGACAEVFLKNNKQITTQAEIEIPGQDMIDIELIQSFMQQNIPGHPTDYPAQIISQIFRELNQEENWKVIDVLAKSVLKREDKKISRFYIEDALMKAGFKPLRQQVNKPVEMEVKEDHTPKAKAATTPQLNEEKLLNDTLKKFLQTIKRELTEEEIVASIGYLKSVFNTFS